MFSLSAYDKNFKSWKYRNVWLNRNTKSNEITLKIDPLCKALNYKNETTTPFLKQTEKGK